MSPTDDLVRRVDDRVAWITLNRPDTLNAITPDQRGRLLDMLVDASASPDVGAVVITGAGDRAFCSGADLATPSGSGLTVERPVGGLAQQVRAGVQRLTAAVLDCEKPVVAAVNGVAAGIGAHLAFSCDIVIASEHARFVESFVRRGLVADAGGTWLLPRLIGLQRAKELLFLGDEVTAARAAELGLVNAVVPSDQLDAEAAAWARRLAHGPTPAISAMKRMTNRAFDMDRAAAFELEATEVEVVRGSHDAGEGLRAFAERRPPRFLGR